MGSDTHGLAGVYPGAQTSGTPSDPKLATGRLNINSVLLGLFTAFEGFPKDKTGLHDSERISRLSYISAESLIALR